jgi:multiple sugar transport system permease protein
MPKERKEWLVGVSFCLPFLLLFLLFVLEPLIVSLINSFFWKSVGAEPVFNGIDNFIFALNFPGFSYVFQNLLLFVIVAVNVKMVLALFLAGILNEEFKGRRIFRALLIIPWSLPMVPSLVTWRWILDTDYGFINRGFLLLGLPQISFLGEYSWAIAMAALYHIWRSLPFYSLMLLAGFQSIPYSLYEAADIDGASWWTKFRKISIPLVKPVYLIATLLSLIWTLGDFTTIWILTRGAPADTTNVFATFAYKFAFQIGNLGAAYATFVMLLPLVFFLIILLLRLIKE